MSESESDSEGEKIRQTKRKVVVKFEFDDSQSSQSDSDVSMQPARTSRRRRRKLSSSEGGEEEMEMESGSSNVRPRRSGSATNTQNSQTFYDDADESSDSSWCPETAGPSSRPNARNMPKKVATECQIEPEDNGGQSDTSSDDAGNEKCPICLHSFREQEIGMPNICEHSFCAPCIEEWSKNVQTCPIDRKEFSYIIVRDRYENGKFVRQIKVVAQSNTLSLDDDDNDVTLCEICSHGDREDRMLLCDDCNLGYHMDCLNPPLTDVPTGSWYCDNCFASEQSSDEDDINQLIEELETEIGIPETRLRVRRVGDQPRITRTRQSERIRASILNRIAPSRRHASVNQEESALGMILPGWSITFHFVTFIFIERIIGFEKFFFSFVTELLVYSHVRNK